MGRLALLLVSQTLLSYILAFSPESSLRELTCTVILIIRPSFLAYYQI
jgi:hypothetical protein